MNCPTTIAEVLLEILTTGILRIRCAEDTARTFNEADHLHNLPELLKNYSPELLKFYWEVTRPCFIAECERRGTLIDEAMESLWERLRERSASCGEIVLCK